MTMRIKNFQKIIDLLRQKRKLPQAIDIIQKFEEFKLYNDIHTVILGHSHLEVGYIATKGEFNLCTSAQDLYYTYHLFKYINNPNIKKIIIPISYFFAWSTLLRSSVLPKNVLTFKKLFGIEYQDNDLAKQLGFFKLERAYFPYIDKLYKEYKLKTHTLGNYAYLKTYPGNFSTTDVQEKSNKILRTMNNHPHIQLEYVKKFIEDIKNEQKIYFVLTPIDSELRALLPNKEEIFKEFYQIIDSYKSDSVKVINLYDSDSFNRQDFFDHEHVNISGAFKLTSIIRKSFD